MSDLLSESAQGGSPPSGDTRCDGSTDQVGLGTPSRGNADCSIKSGAAAPVPANLGGALRVSGPSGGPSAAKVESKATERGSHDQSPAGAMVRPPIGKSDKGKGLAPAVGALAPIKTSPAVFLAARPAEVPAQAAATQKPAAPFAAAAMSPVEEATLTTITRMHTSQVTIRVTKTRTKTVSPAGWTSPSSPSSTRTPGQAEAAAGSPAVDKVGQDTAKGATKAASRTPDYSRASPAMDAPQLAAPAPAPTTQKRLALPGGFTTVPTRASNRPSETRE